MSIRNPPKGSFKDMVCCLLDTAIPCFGEDVCYRPKRGGNITIKAVFDLDAIQVDADTEEVISTNNPRIGIKLSDLPFEPACDDLVDVCGKTYKVIDPREDGQGGATLLLVEVC